MPSGPSSRGCDACRKRKKKCDGGITGCSRCRQLGISCIGGGKQRYSFRDENQKLERRYRGASSSLNGTSVVSKRHASVVAVIAPSRTPSNGLTRLTDAFLSGVSPTIDISYQLVANFGGFLLGVPKRLGSNEALDATADVLVTAHAKYIAGQRSPDTVTLSKYSRAISAVAKCLNDPVKAHASETLCAVMMVSMCEIFLGYKDKPSFSHSAGAAQILKSRGFSGPDDDFERLLLLHLRGPVVLEALSNDGIKFTDYEWRRLVMPGLDSGTLDGDFMVILGQMPNLMQRGREAIRQQNAAIVDLNEVRSDIERLDEVRSDIEKLDIKFQPVLNRLHERWTCTQNEIAEASSSAYQTRRFFRCHHSRMLAFGLTVGILLNSIQNSIGNYNGYLSEESSRMAGDILKLADVVREFRPLGASAMTTFLSAAWVGASDAKMKNEIEIQILNFRQDLFGYAAPLTEESLQSCVRLFNLL